MMKLLFIQAKYQFIQSDELNRLHHWIKSYKSIYKALTQFYSTFESAHCKHKQ